MAVGNKQSCQIWHISNLPAEVEANGWVEVGVCGGEGEGGDGESLSHLGGPTRHARPARGPEIL